MNGLEAGHVFDLLVQTLKIDRQIAHYKEADVKRMKDIPEEMVKRLQVAIGTTKSIALESLEEMKSTHIDTFLRRKGWDGIVVHYKQEVVGKNKPVDKSYPLGRIRGKATKEFDFRPYFVLKSGK